ncbi:MAG: DUF4270 domain-containing protein [Prolixibacteraceae bacterium]|nr:DUF4270 domain-containing protein [Prolixibacteraceae bacterium]
MNKMVRFFLPLFVLAAFFSSCEFTTNDVEYNMGDHFIDDPVNVFMIDTLTVKTYSIVSDSFLTSRTERLLAGRYVNKYGVETLCESYLRFDPTTSSNLSANETAVYDSTCFVIYTDGYKFGDTSVVAGFDVFRVTQKIEYDEDVGYLFNTSEFKTEEEPIGSFSIDFNSGVDSILVRLPDSFGKELYDMVYNEDEILEDNDALNDVVDFKDEFLKGFKIAPKNDNESMIFGLRAQPSSGQAPRIDLYYHDNTVNDNLAISFKMESANTSGVYNTHAFTHIENKYAGSILESDEPGEALEGVEDKRESKYPSSKSNNITMTQAGYLLSTRIEIPYIDNLYGYGNGAIVKAELIINPLDDSFDEKDDLPATLRMNIIDEDNDYFDDLYEVGSQDAAIGKLHYDHEFKSNTHYRFDITNFIKTEYEDRGDKQYSLQLLTPYDPYENDDPDVDQLIIGSPENEDNPMELKVYLTNF